MNLCCIITPILVLGGADDSRNIFRSARLTTSLMGEAAITNPVYKGIQYCIQQDSLAYKTKRKCTCKCYVHFRISAFLSAKHDS